MKKISKDNVVIVFQKKKKPSKVYWIIIAVLAFMFIIYPMIGNHVVYLIHSGFSVLGTVGVSISSIGSIILGLGVLLFLIPLLTGSRGGRWGIKLILIGGFLYILGSFMINPSFITDFLTGSSTPRGYH